MIPEAARDTVRVAVVAHSERQRRYLAEVLEPNGVQVVSDETLRACLPDRVDQSLADVLLVDLQEEVDGDIDLDTLIDQTPLPMLFNDGDAKKRHAPKSIAGRAWGRRLAEKLAALAKEESVAPASVAPSLKLVAEEPAPAPATDDGPDLSAALGFELDPELEFESLAGPSVATPPATQQPEPELPELQLGASIELPELGADDAHPASAMEAPASFEQWSLEPAPEQTDALEPDAGASETTPDFDTVPTLSDDTGLGDLQLADVTDEAVDETFELVDLPELSEDFTLADALASEVQPSDDGLSLDELPALTDEVDLAAALSLDDPSEAVTAELRADDWDDDLASALKLDDLEAFAENVESAGTVASEAPVLDDGQMPVWVLGASIGGPQAVKEFLAKLPAGTGAAFVVAQHIGNGFVDLLASQLGRITNLDVRAAESGMVLGPGQIVVAPVERRLTFCDGAIDLQPNRRKSVYSPSIDDVMTEVARAYGARANAIVFSGMGSDGVEGARAIAEAGGTVWGQEASTCVISSMADSAREAGVVSASGTPAQLAQRLLETLNGETEHA